MGKRLYVGNLPYDADEDAIRTAFAQCGAVERVHIPLDRETQRPRGFAFVELGSDEEAAKAVEALNGSILGTRTLRVSEAEERRPAGGGPRGPGGGGGGGGYDRGPRGGGYDRSGGGDAGSSGAESNDPAERARLARQQRFGPDARPGRDRRGPDRSRRNQGRPRGGGGGGFGGGGGGRGGGGQRYDEDDY